VNSVKDTGWLFKDHGICPRRDTEGEKKKIGGCPRKGVTIQKIVI
jgi:hypothetical protein